MLAQGTHTHAKPGAGKASGMGVMRLQGRNGRFAGRVRAAHILAMLKVARLSPSVSTAMAPRRSHISCVGAGSCMPASAGWSHCFWQSREASCAACESGSGAPDAVQ